jgi:biotin-(acetyl-CoA carboxylase) ligase
MLYQIIGCLSVKAAIKELIDNREIKLKYPNDIYVVDNNGKYKKISGVLSEHSYSGNRCTETILGIGVNVNQIKFDELYEKATSLKLLGYEFEKDEIIEKLKVKLDAYLNSLERNVFNEWKNELNIIGKQVRIVNNNKIYKVISIDNNGTLNAKNDTEEININNGDSVIYDL